MAQIRLSNIAPSRGTSGEPTAHLTSKGLIAFQIIAAVPVRSIVCNDAYLLTFGLHNLFVALPFPSLSSLAARRSNKPMSPM